MNVNVILIVAMIFFAVAIFALILVLIIPSHPAPPEGRMLDAWIATDPDGTTLLYLEKPERNHAFNCWAYTDEGCADISELKPFIQVPSWEDGPVHVELWQHRLDTATAAADSDEDWPPVNPIDPNA